MSNQWASAAGASRRPKRAKPVRMMEIDHKLRASDYPQTVNETATRDSRAMFWMRRSGWIALALATLAVAIIPVMTRLPTPVGAVVLDHATVTSDNDNARAVTLPHAVYPRTSGQPRQLRYAFDFNLSAEPKDHLFLLIPSINRKSSVVFNGETLSEAGSASLWLGPLTAASILVELPSRSVLTGRNKLVLTVEAGDFVVPTYVSQLYVGPEATLVPNYMLRNFFGDQLKTMSLAALVLLGVGLICVAFFRPRDPLFIWLATYSVLLLVLSIGMFVGFQPSIRPALPYIGSLVPAGAFVFIGIALSLVDIRPPKSLLLAAVIVTLAMFSCATIGTMTARMIPAVLAVVAAIMGNLIAAGIIAWGALRRGNADARILLAPILLQTWFAIHDTYVAATLPQHGFSVLLPYARPLFFAAVIVVLMRRMGQSLNQLDRANETLNVKLAEREAELAELHKEDQARIARLVREHERQRLTHDLHDGLSGHLVSIIAMSERAGVDVRPIEQAAREALDDLRLVIYSLDLGDRELSLALANFRERLAPQLHRMGITFDWSIANLPEVSGVTPGNALAVLRILQEAITNAVKHGPARRITVRGVAAGGGAAAIIVENDGRAFIETGGGHGLANMRRRARALNGRLKIETLDFGVRLTLELPSWLPDLEKDVRIDLA